MMMLEVGIDENYFTNVRRRSPRPKKSRKTRKLECEVCYDVVEDAVRCVGKGHACCPRCTERYLGTRLAEGNPHLPCVSIDDCPANLSERDLDALLPPALLRQRDAMLAKQDIARSKLSNVLHCPFCPYAVQMDLTTSTILDCRHPRCRRRSCILCKAEVKNGVVHNCVPPRDDDNIDESGVIRKCPAPGCDAIFLKDSGCNRLKCPQCEILFCFLCNAIVSDYSHFCMCDCTISRRGIITPQGRRPSLRGVSNHHQRCRVCGKCSLWYTDDDDDPLPAAPLDDDDNDLSMLDEIDIVAPPPPPPPAEEVPVPTKQQQQRPCFDLPLLPAECGCY